MSALLRRPRATRYFFDRVLPYYRWLTDNPVWRGSLRELARHLPPGGPALRVLDVGCGHGNSACELLAHRPDLRIIGLDFSPVMLNAARRLSRGQPGAAQRTAWAQADVTRLPLPANSADAIVAHSVFYMLHDRAAFLDEAMRVLRPGGRLIMLDPIERPWPFGVLRQAVNPNRTRIALALFTWHLVSRMHRRFTLAEMVDILQGAGYERVLTEKTVEGFGVLSRGEKPYTHRATIARIASVAARAGEPGGGTPQPGSLEPIAAAALGAALRGRFVYLLVSQPARRPWDRDGQPARWIATLLADRESGDKPLLLAFSALPKAVAFMQTAVLSGAFKGVSKIAKFDKAVAAAWGVDALVNPSFEALNGSARFAASQHTLIIDPASAVTGEE